LLRLSSHFDWLTVIKKTG